MTFTAAAAYEIMLGRLAEHAEPGFSRSKSEIAKSTTHARYEIGLAKSRDTRSDKLIVTIGAHVFLKKLDVLFRTNKLKIKILSPMHGDFYLSYRKICGLPSSHPGYWQITSADELEKASMEAVAAISPASQFFDSLSTDEQAIEGLRSVYRSSGNFSNSQLALPAYLAAMGSLDESSSLLAHLAANYQDKPLVYRHVLKVRDALINFYGHGAPPNNSFKPKPLRGSA